VPRIGLRLAVDGERIAQVFANLLSNAVKYSEAGTRIWVEAARIGERVRVVVKDEGTGIEPERLATVFEAFHQTPELRPRSSGLGLGLAIARSLVELHNGTLTIHSEGSGRGTECVVELPSEAPASSQPSVTTSLRKRLLLVEDNDDTARALKTALEQLGYVVAVAHSAPIALNVARTFDPDVALLDIGLPVMDGWELAKRLREQRSPREIHIVAVTAYDQESDKRRSEEAGFAEHLIKPIDLGKLEEVVESLPDSAI
jgi:CheY-like chemotaxis protein/anti-sigma regulatory factor (Ser/Thr protein kinase)